MQTMERTRDRNIRIANEGLLLVMKCKTPRFCSSVEFDDIVKQQQEWTKRLPRTLPPLVDWINQHRQVLFSEEKSQPDVEDFQKRFVLVFLELQSLFDRDFAFALDCSELQIRLFKFSVDVKRILTTNTAIRSWLFHYYGSELGLQGWQCRLGDLYGLHYLCNFLTHQELDLDVIFGQKMLSFLESIGKELLRFQQSSECQGMGVVIMANVMNINYKKQNYTNDAEESFKMALRLNWKVMPDIEGYDLWSLMYYSISSIRNANCSLGDELMLNLLAHLHEQLVEKEEDPTFLFGELPLAYMRAVTLLLLLDVPEVGVQDCWFTELTISGRVCNRAMFRRHVKSRLRTDNLRYSMNIRLRIARIIPKLFAGFTSHCYVNSDAFNCLELLTWLTMFPVGQTRQEKNAKGLMLKRLLEEMKRLCENDIQNSSVYRHGANALRILYNTLNPLLSVVREGIKQLPNAGWFRRFKCNMQMHITAVLYLLELMLQRAVFLTDLYHAR